MGEALILGGARTPFATWAGGKRGDGSPGGALKALDPFDLGAAAVKGALEHSGVPVAAVERVVFSHMYAVGPHACYGARYVSLRAGLPEDIPALTVGMACGSGLYAVIAAAQDAARGEAAVLVAGGSDNISQVRRDVFVPSFKDISCGRQIGSTVEDMAKERGVSRQAQDRWALLSHQRARQAQRENKLAEEIAPAGGLREDDAVLPEPSPEPFSASKPAYGEEGTVTRANSHGLVDAGSALVLASPEGAARVGASPLGRLADWALIGIAPDRMGYASVPAIRKVLEHAGLKAEDIDLYEINETFAAQLLIDLRELGLPEEKVNVNGGAVALGHPFAATGCRQVLSLLLELRRRKLKRGIASICVGGGLGVAALVEAL